MTTTELKKFREVQIFRSERGDWVGQAGGYPQAAFQGRAVRKNPKDSMLVQLGGA